MAKLFADGLGFPEAPVLLSDGGLLCVEMTPETGCITYLAAGGASRRMVAKTGRPNGLAMDRDGAIWVAETSQRALLKMSLNGESQIVASGFEGGPFLFLNDVAIGPNGDIFLTDSGIDAEVLAPAGELNPNYRDLPYDGRIFRIDPRSGAVECIDRGMKFTNGLAFGPDGHLYINETLTGAIYRYRCEQGRVVGKREAFGNVIESFNPAELKGPDGMKFAADGSLFVCVFGQGDITILALDGSVRRRIKAPGGHPTNLTFGKPGEKIMYVTEVETGAVHVMDAGVDGFPLHQ